MRGVIKLNGEFDVSNDMLSVVNDTFGREAVPFQDAVVAKKQSVQTIVAMLALTPALLSAALGGKIHCLKEGKVLMSLLQISQWQQPRAEAIFRSPEAKQNTILVWAATLAHQHCKETWMGHCTL